MEIQIRSMAIEHAPDVQQLSGQLGYPLSISEIESNIAEVMSAKGQIAFVALHNEKIVGWIHAFRSVLIESNPFVEIGGLVVDEDPRGKGIGKRLVGRIKMGLENGFHDLRVRSNVKRKEAHKFYTGIGFAESKEQKVFQMSL